MSKARKGPPKVSGLVRSGHLTKVDSAITELMPDFNTSDFSDNNSVDSKLAPADVERSGEGSAETFVSGAEEIKSGLQSPANISDPIQPGNRPLEAKSNLGLDVRTDAEGVQKATPPLPPGPIAPITPNSRSSRVRLKNESEDHDAAPVVMIDISLIKYSPYQNRIGTDDTYVADLADNIKEDGLNSPITVRPCKDGTMELIAGAHRYEAFTLLGRSHVPSRIKDVDDKKAARLVVFDNIFHKPPTDYEIFRGYQTLLAMGAVASKRALAKERGESAMQIQRIMAFEGLPKEVIELLEVDPKLLGGNAALQLAKHVEGGEGNLVTEAVKLISTGKLTQGRAHSWIENRATKKPQKMERVLTYGQGKQFCKLIREGIQIRINLSKNIDSQNVEAAIFSLLQEYAKTADSSEEGTNK